MPYEFTNLLILRDTEKAYHVEQTKNGEKVKVWVPRSVCTYKKLHPVDRETGNQHIDLKIEDWFVEKEDCKLII
jgi:hypothetical protein